VEAHVEEELARGVNLNGGRTGGVDHDGGHVGDMDLDGGGGQRGVEVDAEEERSVRHWRGGGRRNIKADTEERLARRRCGGSRHDVEADA
jgi:hypothetical protein